MTTIRFARPMLSIPVAATFALSTAPALAQDMRMVSLETKDTTSKYTQQHTLDVADAPGHQIRIYEIHRVFGKDAPVVEGIRMKENWIRGTTDYVKENGPGSSYGEYVMENGDRIFTHSNLVAQSVRSGPASLRNMSTATIIAGTGKFRGIRGMVRGTVNANPKSGFFESTGEMEYWIQK